MIDFRSDSSYAHCIVACEKTVAPDSIQVIVDNPRNRTPFFTVVFFSEILMDHMWPSITRKDSKFHDRSHFFQIPELFYARGLLTHLMVASVCERTVNNERLMYTCKHKQFLPNGKNKSGSAVNPIKFNLKSLSVATDGTFEWEHSVCFCDTYYKNIL